MELKKRITIDGKECEFIFFTVQYSHFRDVETAPDQVVRDRVCAADDKVSGRARQIPLWIA